MEINCNGNLSKSEKCTPSALIFLAKDKSFPTRIFKPRGLAKARIFLAKISRSFFSKSYSRIMIAEFFGKSFMADSRLVMTARLLKKTLTGKSFFELLFLNLFISNETF